MYGCLYVEAAPTLNIYPTYNTYDWSNGKISYKISAHALDQILLLFNNTKQTSTLIRHESATHVKSFHMEYETSELKSMKLELEQIGTTGIKKLSIILTMAEVQGLQVLLNKAKERIYGW